jgi:plasmid stability protein
MADLTITLDDELLRRARLRARQQNTSVDALLRDYLEAFAATGTAWDQATDAILQLSARSRSACGDRRWTRDDLHEREKEEVLR